MKYDMKHGFRAAHFFRGTKMTYNKTCINSIKLRRYIYKLSSISNLIFSHLQIKALKSERFALNVTSRLGT